MSYRDPYEGPPMRLAMPSLTPVVKAILIANVAVGVLQVLIGRSWSPTLVPVFGVNPSWWASFYFPLWQLVTYAFVHGGVWHLFFNMLMLYFFGTMLETIVGSRRFAVFYTVAFLVGGVAHLLAELTWGAGVPAIGASGATMAVMIAMAVLRPHTMVIVFFLPVKLWILACVLAGIDLLRLMNDLRYGASDGVAYMVHLGGAAVGYLGARKGWIWRDPLEAAARKRRAVEAEKQVRDDARMDELLAKIHREGMNALSRQEREFLKRMSKRS